MRALSAIAATPCPAQPFSSQDRPPTAATPTPPTRIDVPLRGRWCTLITPGEAIAICANDGAARGAVLPPAGDAVDAGAQQRFASPRDDDDVRVVAING